MGTDWERMQGQGGAYLVERAAAVLQNGRLTPLAVALVAAEVERLKFILDEEVARLQPAGDLTPAAIAALRAYYQGRLDAALNVIVAAARISEAPTLPSPASGGGKVTSATLPAPASGGGNVTAPTLPSPASWGGKDAPPASGGGKDAPPASGGGQERSWREFFADRSILILSYVGAFLLIVATLLFELSAFSAVDSTARFAGVLTLNLVFGLAGWLCFRLPAMRLVGRTYVAIAALMVPLTFIAAW